MGERVDTLGRWHAIARSGDPAGLDDLLADEVVFHSPIVHTPQRGKAIASIYLVAAIRVLSASEFRYVREVVGDSDAALEFLAVVDGIQINGIDLIHWNADGLIDDFKVMIRPLKAVQLLHRLMAQMLEQLAPKN